MRGHHADAQARAALGLTLHECVDPNLGPAARYQLDLWRADVLDRVSFDETANGLMVRVYARHGAIKLRPDDRRFEGKTLPTPKLSRHEIDFRLDGEGFKITPETAAAGVIARLSVSAMPISSACSARNM